MTDYMCCEIIKTLVSISRECLYKWCWVVRVETYGGQQGAL